MGGRRPVTNFVEGTPEEPVSAVAARALGPRLALVLELLPRAALHADQDIEHVHQLRVASRRERKLYDEAKDR